MYLIYPEHIEISDNGQSEQMDDWIVYLEFNIAV